LLLSWLRKILCYPSIYQNNNNNNNNDDEDDG
jgi:hypothetical protein